MIQFSCPQCQSSFKTAKPPGTRSKCPRCGGIVAVPAAALQPSLSPPVAALQNSPGSAVTTAPPAKQNRGLFLWGFAAGSIVTASLIGICGGGLWFVSSQKGGPMLAGLGQPDYKAIVIDHLMKTLNDTDGFEVIEWGEPQQVLIDKDSSKKLSEYEETVRIWERDRADFRRGLENATDPGPKPREPAFQHTPGTAIRLKFRCRQGGRDREIGDMTFLVQDGKVARKAYSVQELGDIKQ